MKGDAGPTNNQGNYGIQGVASPTNEPPAAYGPNFWTDLQGNFWIFGGVSDPNMSQSGACNNLWKYDVSTNMWTWVKGPGNVLGQGGVYGTQGIPSVLNTPGAMGYVACNWTDDAGDLWMLGEQGPSAWQTDLWRYHIATNEWTWMKGYSTPAGYSSNYGTKGIESPTNLPPLRSELSSCWKDFAGNLWFLGGSNDGGQYLNDLWRYNVSTNNFTWMKGSNLGGQPGVYGTLGVPNAANTPAAAYAYTKSVDLDGNFWFFAGSGPWGFPGCSAVWKFTVATNQWTWMDGSSVPATTHFGTLCEADQINQPPVKFENRACWTDRCGNFFNFGGWRYTSGSNDSYNDLWYYDIQNLAWKWIGGDNFPNSAGNYGIKSVMVPSNIVPARAGSCSFTDNAGNFWLFGGWREGGRYNDLWKYTITDTTCVRSCADLPTPTTVAKEEYTFYAPNSFSPNGDGSNESWLPKGTGIDETSYELTIFDRWGNLIFRTNKWGEAWDGRLKGGKLAETDVYVWKAAFKDEAFEEQHRLIGRITVLR